LALHGIGLPHATLRELNQLIKLAIQTDMNGDEKDMKTEFY
jgi:hypothetical protein